MVLALPVLRHLKSHYPASRIYWWIDSRLNSLLEGDPDLEGVILFERRHWRRPAGWLNLWRSVRQARAMGFDLVIDLQGLARSAAFAWLVNGALTVGLDDSREGAPGLYDVIVPRPAARRHAADWYLEVLRRLKIPLAPSINWMPAHPRVRERVQERWQTAGSQWIALIPGAKWGDKRWPAEHFAAVARRLGQAALTVRFVVLGGLEDAGLGREIAGHLPGRCLNLAGKTTLPEMVEWIRLAEFVVSNDTGPMHVAAALGKPVWAVFGPTDPAETGPYGQIERTFRLNLPCSPCQSPTCRHAPPMECLRALDPGMVSGAILASRMGLGAFVPPAS